MMTTAGTSRHDDDVETMTTIAGMRPQSGHDFFNTGQNTGQQQSPGCGLISTEYCYNVLLVMTMHVGR